MEANRKTFLLIEKEDGTFQYVDITNRRIMSLTYHSDNPDSLSEAKARVSDYFEGIDNPDTFMVVLD